MTTPEEKALAYTVEAQKCAKKMFGGSAKAEEACSLYTKAANAYKMSKNWTLAGKSFTEAAKIQLNRLKTKHEAARLYGEAANCYRKEDPRSAIKCLETSNGIYNDMGKFNFVAKNNVTIAELYESKEVEDFGKAMQHYSEAADFYRTEQSSSSANKCLVKVAHYAAQEEQYEKAANIYEEVASACLDNSLTKYSAQGYLFRAGLCRMCGSFPTSIQPHLDRYSDLSPPFDSSRESQFLRKLATALDERSDLKYVMAIDEYNRSVKLDIWFKTLLTRLLDKAFPQQNLLGSDNKASSSSSSWGGMLSFFGRTDKGKFKSASSSSAKSPTVKPLTTKSTSSKEAKEENKSTSSFFGGKSSKEDKTSCKNVEKEDRSGTGKNSDPIPHSADSKTSRAAETSGTNPFDDGEDDGSTNPFHDDSDDFEVVGTNPFDEADDEEASRCHHEKKKEMSSNPFDEDDDVGGGTNPFEDGDLR